MEFICSGNNRLCIAIIHFNTKFYKNIYDRMLDNKN